MKITVSIITFNEELNIRRCLESVLTVADEIVVVDSFSADQTEAICREFNVRFIQNVFRGHIEQKNFAVSQALHDFVLSLDADEALSDILRDSILEIKKTGKADAYAFNRLNNYCGTFIYHGVWYPDRKLRLWNKNKGAWGGENPHDQVIMKPGASALFIKGHLLHYTYRSPADHLLQMNKFSDIAAKEAFKKGKKTSTFVHLFLYPIFTFFKSYFFKRGFLDGYYGYIVAVNAAYYRFLKYLKLKLLWDKSSNPAD
jgi:glycosyltransferase involved in cell wall biosynthesis